MGDRATMGNATHLPNSLGGAFGMKQLESTMSLMVGWAMAFGFRLPILIPPLSHASGPVHCWDPPIIPHMPMGLSFSVSFGLSLPYVLHIVAFIFWHKNLNSVFSRGVWETR